MNNNSIGRRSSVAGRSFKARDDRRRRRADGELGEEEDLARQPKQDNHYLTGIFAAKPAHFGAVWPTVRTETFVEMVFGSIQKRGRATRGEILADTKLDDDRIGVALADLLLWRKTVGSELKEEDRAEAREYFVK